MRLADEGGRLLAKCDTGLIAFVTFLVFAGYGGTTVSQMPDGGYADTECTTNFPVSIDLGTINRMSFALTLEYSPTNSLEVSIGTDLDGDGRLALGEFAYTFGFDCGRWFVRDVAEDAFSSCVADDRGRISRTFLLKRRKLDPEWNMVRVTRRGLGEVLEFVTVEGLKPGMALIVR